MTKRMHANVLIQLIINKRSVTNEINMLRTNTFEAAIVVFVLLDILYLSRKGSGSWVLLTYHSLTKESECIQESCGK